MAVPGSADYPEQADPMAVNVEVKVDHFPKCDNCGRTLAEYLGRPWSIKCRKCGEQNSKA